MKNDQSSIIKTTFFDIYRAIEDMPDEEIVAGAADPFRPHLELLNQIAALDVDEQVLQELLRDTELRQMISRIARVKRLHSTRLETTQALELVGAIDPWQRLSGFVYYPNYVQLARMECSGAGLSAGDHVVFIGSGSLPLSLILLCKLYGVSATGIERDPRFVSISQQLLDKLGLADSVRIIEGDHFSVSPRMHSKLLMVGAEALPKDEIFNHLAAVLSPGAKVSYRIFEKGLRALLDDQSQQVLPTVFREFLRVRPEPPVNNTVVFVVKEQ